MDFAQHQDLVLAIAHQGMTMAIMLLLMLLTLKWVAVHTATKLDDRLARFGEELFAKNFPELAKLLPEDHIKDE